jgi:hypothetical protein
MVGFFWVRSGSGESVPGRGRLLGRRILVCG